MQKTRIIMGVLVLLGLAVTARLWAQQPGQGVQESSVRDVPNTSAITTLGGVLVSTESLLGSSVKNPQGDTVGTLAHLIMNPQSGACLFCGTLCAVVCAGPPGFWGPQRLSMRLAGGLCRAAPTMEGRCLGELATPIP